MTVEELLGLFEKHYEEMAEFERVQDKLSSIKYDNHYRSSVDCLMR